MGGENRPRSRAVDDRFTPLQSVLRRVFFFLVVFFFEFERRRRRGVEARGESAKKASEKFSAGRFKIYRPSHLAVGGTGADIAVEETIAIELGVYLRRVARGEDA
jgi:hypothetical protein